MMVKATGNCEMYLFPLTDGILHISINLGCFHLKVYPSDSIETIPTVVCINSYSLCYPNFVG